jgi:hypothetical protein
MRWIPRNWKGGSDSIADCGLPISDWMQSGSAAECAARAAATFPFLKRTLIAKRKAAPNFPERLCDLNDLPA